jgi:hypothetical protein
MVNQISSNAYESSDGMTPTSTIRIKLKGTIYPRALFLLLPVVTFNIERERESSAIVIPYFPEAIGHVYSASFGGKARGTQIKKGVNNIITTDDLGFFQQVSSFKNSLQLYMVGPVKNMSIKISKKKDDKNQSTNMNFTGCRGIEEVRQTAKMLITSIYLIQEVIDILSANLVLANQIFLYYRLNCQGPIVCREDGELEFLTIEPTNIPESFPQLIVDYFHQMINNYPYYSVFLNILEVLNSFPTIVEGKLVAIYLKEDMVNRHYHLSFQPNLNNLAQILYSQSYNNFILSQQDSSISNSVKIALPYEDMCIVPKESKKKTKHSFIVRKTGTVFHSGPGQAYLADGSVIPINENFIDCEKAYLAFMDMMTNLQSRIEWK